MTSWLVLKSAHRWLVLKRPVTFWRTLSDSGFLTRLTSNALLQTGILAALTGLCWHLWSATPGKIVVRIKIADADTGQPISHAQIVLRLLGYVISTICLCFGFFWIVLDKRRQGWHDKLAHTVVVGVPRKAAGSAPVTLDAPASPEAAHDSPI
jgi:uncharacterized RDD family membrane protein YckC